MSAIDRISSFVIKSTKECCEQWQSCEGPTESTFTMSATPKHHWMLPSSDAHSSNASHSCDRTIIITSTLCRFCGLPLSDVKHEPSALSKAGGSRLISHRRKPNHRVNSDPARNVCPWNIVPTYHDCLPHVYHLEIQRV